MFVSAQGAGGLGYAFPAAVGAAFGGGAAPVLAVSGDGGAMYGIAELATAVQHNVDVTWLIVNSGGYGVLDGYMKEAFGVAFAVDLATPDFVALAAAFGVPARLVTGDDLERALHESLHSSGPSVIVLDASPQLFPSSRGDRTR